MDMYWPADTKIVSNVAREAKRVAHPWLIQLFAYIKLKDYKVRKFNYFTSSFYYFTHFTNIILVLSKYWLHDVT